MTRMDEWCKYEEKKEGEIIFRELSYQIMQAVFEVHNTLGPGFMESVYEEALACELEIGKFHLSDRRRSP